MTTEAHTEKYDKLYQRMVSNDTYRGYDAILREVMTTLEREDPISFLESIRFEKAPLLSECDMNRLDTYEKILSVSLEQLANVWDASPRRAAEIREFQVQIRAGASYSRKAIESLWHEATENLASAVRFITIGDLKSAGELVLNSLYAYNAIDAHELTLLRETRLRDGLIDTLLVGMSALRTHVGGKTTKAVRKHGKT